MKKDKRETEKAPFSIKGGSLREKKLGKGKRDARRKRWGETAK